MRKTHKIKKLYRRNKGKHNLKKTVKKRDKRKHLTRKNLKGGSLHPISTWNNIWGNFSPIFDRGH